MAEKITVMLMRGVKGWVTSIVAGLIMIPIMILNLVVQKPLITIALSILLIPAVLIAWGFLAKKMWRWN